jgi:hypothetical protein
VRPELSLILCFVTEVYATQKTLKAEAVIIVAVSTFWPVTLI